MDLRSALAAVADQIKTTPSSTKKRVSSKKKKQHTSNKKNEKKSDESSSSHQLSSGEEEDKIRTKVIKNLSSAKRAYNEITEIKKYYDDHLSILDENDFAKQATLFIKAIKEKLESVTKAAGIRADLKRCINECNSLLDGIESEDVTLSKELTLETLDALLAVSKNWIRIYNKKHEDISDTIENAERVSVMLQNNLFKKLSEASFPEDFEKGLIEGYSVLPLGSFSAKLLEKFFKADASGGYPILPNQTFYAVNFKKVDRKTFDLERELRDLSTPSTQYELVSKKPKLYNGYVIYWVMTHHQLDLLKRSAAYQDYMMLKDWNYL